MNNRTEADVLRDLQNYREDGQSWTTEKFEIISYKHESGNELKNKYLPDMLIRCPNCQGIFTSSMCNDRGVREVELLNHNRVTLIQCPTCGILEKYRGSLTDIADSLPYGD